MRLESVKAEILQIESEIQKFPLDATSWREIVAPAIKTQLQPIVDRLERELSREKDSRAIKQIFEIHNLTNRVIVKILEARINYLSNLLLATFPTDCNEVTEEKGSVCAKWYCLL